MSDFPNAPPPNGALFYDAPEMHDLNGPFLTGEQLEAIRQGERIAALEEHVKDLQAQLAELGELRELNIQLKAMRSDQQASLDAMVAKMAWHVADIIHAGRADEPSRE